ncbi:efflux RND transporter periplasmic adaptor subunit [Desulfosporosinus burensis]
MNKKWVTIGVIGVLVMGGGYWGYTKFTAKPAVSSNITAKAKMGNVSKVITATGTVSFPHSIPLTFPNTGRIVELNVQPGDSVKAGQVLAKMDDTKLQTAVLQQEANLTAAQSKLQILQDGFNAQTKAQAEAALAKAQQSLTTAQQNADPSYLANQVLLANQNVKLTSDALAKAQQSGNTSSLQSAQSSLNQALAALTTAQNAQNGGAALALASAQAEVTAAQYQVDKQADGPKSGDLQSAQASIAIAQAQLASAQTDLKNATIIAPTDAIVVSSPLQLYEYTNANSIITLTPTGSNFQVEAMIDQADIAQVEVGQKVDITLDAYPDEHSSGSVSLVALQGTTASNVTTFKVTVSVEQASDKLRSGMNANLDIVVAEAKDVLTVPSEAIKTRGTKKGVMVPATSTQPSTNSKSATNPGSGQSGANLQFIPVECGLDDGTNVEIKSGIKEGQEVVTAVSSSATAKASTGGFSLGGGNKTMGGPPRN